jgi:hypothetical protein
LLAFSLAVCGLGDAGATALAAVMKVNATLTELNIESENVFIRTRDGWPRSDITKAISRVCAGNAISAAGGAALATMLGSTAL